MLIKFNEGCGLGLTRALGFSVIRGNTTSRPHSLTSRAGDQPSGSHWPGALVGLSLEVTLSLIAINSFVYFNIVSWLVLFS